MRLVTGAMILLVAVGAGTGAAESLDDPRADVTFVVPGLRALMDWVTFRLTFDAESMRPDMAAGSFETTVSGTPKFAVGVKGKALVCGPGSGQAIYPRERNAELATRGAPSRCGSARWHGRG